MDRIAGIENTLDKVFDIAERTGTTPLSSAHALARERLSGSTAPGSRPDERVRAGMTGAAAVATEEGTGGS